MGYYDNYDDYEYSSYEEHLEPVMLVAGDCNEKDITETLTDAGILIDKQAKFVGSMERIVFTYGDPNEVYSSSEISFTEDIDKVYVYPEFFKNARRGKMACRVIAAQINCEGREAVKACVSFEKIINKAFDSFNLFFFVTQSGVYFGCRIYSRDGMHDCMLSKPILLQSELEQIQDEFSSLTITDDFITFYEQCLHVFIGDIKQDEDYETMVLKKKGVQYAYLEELDKISRDIHLNLSGEKERYKHFFDGETELSFYEIFEEVEEDLAFIKSNRVNTYELLFEADEAMRQAELEEAERNKIREQIPENEIAYEDTVDYEIEMVIDDPEAMINLLKRRKGI